MQKHSSEVGYLGLTLRLFGTEVFYFRLDVDDFKTKWALLGIGLTVALTYLAINTKELL